MMFDPCLFSVYCFLLHQFVIQLDIFNHFASKFWYGKIKLILENNLLKAFRFITLTLSSTDNGFRNIIEIDRRYIIAVDK